MPTKTLSVQVTVIGETVTLKLAAADFRALLGPAPVAAPIPPPTPAPVVTPKPAPVPVPKPIPRALQMPNSISLVWPADPAFVGYGVWRQRGGRLFYPVCRFTTLTTWTEQALPDGEAAVYRLYGFEASGTGRLLAELSTAQTPRVWIDDQLKITEGKTYTGNYRNLDPTRPAVLVADNLKGWSFSGRIASRGDGIRLGVGSDGTVKNVAAFALHPGAAGRTTGMLVAGYKPAGITVDQISFENWMMGLYVDGAGTEAVQRIVMKNFRSFDMNSRLTTADGYAPIRGYAGHFFQANSCRNVPLYDVLDGEAIQEYGVGMVEDGASNYRSSGTTQRPYRIQRLCIYGMYPFDGHGPTNTPEGYNYGCGILSESIDPAQPDGTGRGIISDNVVIACGNAGVSVQAGTDQEVARNRIITSGFLPDGAINNATNVGMYIGNLSGEALRNTNVHDNASMCWDRPGSVNKKDGGYYNNGYDFSGIGQNGNVESNNVTLDGDGSLQREADEHSAWALKQARAGTLMGAQTLGS